MTKNNQRLIRENIRRCNIELAAREAYKHGSKVRGRGQPVTVERLEKTYRQYLTKRYGYFT